MQPLIIKDIQIEFYRRAFLLPFTIAGIPLKHRDGYYITIKANGLTVKAEASPLEGYSFESLKKAHHDLKRFRDLFLNQEIPVLREQLFLFLKNGLEGCCASSRCAFESALIDLAAEYQGVSVVEYLGGKVRLQETVGLLQGNNMQIRELAQQYVSKGCRILKLKVGDRNIPMDVIKVRDVRAILGVGGKLRLDANRSWKLPEAVQFAQLIGQENIQFIEEALLDPAQLPLFYEQTHFPIALDETLLTSRVDVTAPGRCMPTLVDHDAVQFYVIKPSLLGGVLVTLAWIEHARLLGKRVVVSSMFETEVGMDMLKSLSYLTTESPGFGAQDWLKS